MTGRKLHAGGKPAANGAGVTATATFMVSDQVVVTASVLCRDDGEFTTVTLAWPDGDTHVVIAGTRHELTRILREALAALDDDPVPQTAV